MECITVTTAPAPRKLLTLDSVAALCVARGASDPVRRTRTVTIQRADTEQQIVYGEVYAPYRLDSYSEFMLPHDIELMAHRFMRLDLSGVIDTQHDNVANGSYPIESFIARKGDPDYTEGAWVIGVKITDDAMWQRVKSGELNGFSFQAMVYPAVMDVEVAIQRDHVGVTEAHEGHTHTFVVQLDETGALVGGHTSVTNGHSHTVRRGTATDEADAHAHRYFL